MPRRPLIRSVTVMLASILSGHPGLIALVPVLVFLIVRRLAGGRRRARNLTGPARVCRKKIWLPGPMSRTT
jgi:hypothetical protein